MTVQIWFWTITTFLFGICIGSFLNVVIYRLPRNLSVNEPKWSFCPNCPVQSDGHKRRLSTFELIPLVSYLALGRRCHSCKQPISSRYFWVELLTGVLFVVLYLRFHDSVPNTVALLLFAAVMVPVYFIDFEFFIIPISLNLLAFLIAVGRDIYGIVTREPGHALLWGWLPPSLFGALFGVLIFGTVRIAGWIWKRQEAMGLGDVYLARAMGAMLVSFVPVEANPLRLFPIWVILCCGSGAIVGPALILLRRRQEAKAALLAAKSGTEGGIEEGTEDWEEEQSDLQEQLLDVAQVLWLNDAFLLLCKGLLAVRLMKMPPDTHWLYAALVNEGLLEIEQAIEEENWTPAATAIPFGPFLILGFLATVLVGEPLTAMYLAYALPKPTGPS